MRKTALKKQRIVLLGGGHAHVEAVRRIGLARIPCEVILVSPARYTPYSGMLPGYVAGRYAFEDFHIDLEALCARANVDFHAGTAVDIDVAARHVSLADGSILAYDILSLDIGSTPSLPAGVSEGVAVKPISNFANKLVSLDKKVRSSSTRFQIAVVGQGVAGVEIAFALNQRFRGAPVSTGDDPEGVDIILLGRGAEILPERSASHAGSSLPHLSARASKPATASMPARSRTGCSGQAMAACWLPTNACGRRRVLRRDCFDRPVYRSTTAVSSG